MGNCKFERRQKEEKPVLAICYDFDKTLSPDDMQAQGFIQSVGKGVEEFWKESNGRAEANEMDSNLSYMYQMLDLAIGNVIFNKKNLLDYGAKVKLFPGVQDWFQRIKKYGEENDVIVEHYIISSGLKEMIEGTSVANEFEKIYASSFFYNEKGVATWPAQVVNFTNKTQFLFRIEKGVLDINDPGVNDYFPPNELRVPFRNMVYIGDSDTDVPCMKLVNANGGHSIGVYNPETKDKTKVFKMLNDNRIKYFVPADYSENSKLDKLIKSIIVNTRISDLLENTYYDCKEETDEYIRNQSEEEREKQTLIFNLEVSGNFATTHTIIGELSKYNNWTNRQVIELATIAVENSQVWWILNDDDISIFYKQLLTGFNSGNKNIKKIKKELKIKE